MELAEGQEYVGLLKTIAVLLVYSQSFGIGSVGFRAPPLVHVDVADGDEDLGSPPRVSHFLIEFLGSLVGLVRFVQPSLKIKNHANIGKHACLSKSIITLLEKL